MRLERLEIKNYRSILSLTLDFDDGYTAVSGRNDAGKSSVFDAIKVLIGRDREPWMMRREALDFSNDFPRWMTVEDDSEISISGTFSLLTDRETNLKNFCAKQLSLPSADFDRFTIEVKAKKKSTQQNVVIQINNQVCEGENAFEVWRKIRQDGSLIFHNSTTDSFRLSFGDAHGEFSQLTEAVTAIRKSIKQDFKTKLKKATSSSQIALQDMFGSLSDNLRVSVEVADFEAFVPFNLFLGDPESSVSLEAWGSGTKNKSLIILAIMRALQIAKSSELGDRLVPLIVIEEPESFLHPSAQAELGTFLIQQSQSSNIQIISATHSAYLLNTKTSRGNILLDRNKTRGKLRETIQIPVQDENWMKPFAKVLGLSEESLKPWRDVISSRDKKVILVEGSIDKEYLNILQSPSHGKNALDSEATVISYGGTGQLLNQSIIKMILRLADRVIITYDLDAAEKVEKTLATLNLRKGIDFLAIGSSKPNGIRSIEGLLPASVKNSVTISNPEVFQRAAGTDADAKQAKLEIKKLYLAEFERASAVAETDLKEFYLLVAALKRALASDAIASC